MQLMQQNEGTAARRRILIYLVDDTDGKSAETGITISAGDVKISKNGAAEANHAGTLTELATGTYYYEFTNEELETLGFLQFKLTKSGVRTFVKELQVVPWDPYDSVRMGMTALPNAAADAAGGLTISDAGGLDLDGQDTNINQIEADTNELQGDWKNGGRLDLIIDAILDDTDILDHGTYGLIQIKSDTAAILTDTNELQGDWTDGGRLDLIIDSILVDTGTTLDGLLDDIIAGTSKVTPIDVDGLTFASMMEAVTATLCNVTTAPASNQISFKKADGTTEKVLVTYHATSDGVRTASTIT